MDVNQELLTNIMMVLVSTFGPTFATYIGLHLRRANQRAQKEHWYVMAQEYAATGVRAAEQLGITDELKDYAGDKFEYAISYVDMMLTANGLSIDLDAVGGHLKAIIEAEVNQLPISLPAVYTTEVLHQE